MYDKQELLNELCAEYSTCDLCPELLGRHNLVFGQGNPDARVLIVGEAPGEHEDDEGCPFVGASKDLFDEFLVSCDQPGDRSTIWLTNTILCRPTRIDDNRIVNRQPSKIELMNCGYRLRREIAIVDPYVIIVLGSVALKTLVRATLEISATTENHKVERVKLTCGGVEIEYPVISAYHPAFILRQGSRRARALVQTSLENWRYAFYLAALREQVYRGGF